VKDVRGQDLGFLKVKLQQTRVYVHEPLRVTFDYGIDASLAPVRGRAGNGQLYYDIELQAPWLDAPEGAGLIEGKQGQDHGGGEAGVVGNQKLLEVTYDKGFQRQGRAYHRFLLERAYLPSRIGKQRLAAPMLRFQVQTGRNQRSLFDSMFEDTRGENH